LSYIAPGDGRKEQRIPTLKAFNIKAQGKRSAALGYLLPPIAEL
jgi:hypothetical protein